jgi:uncharacterized membrane protein YoaK (UPF0700 family)
MSAVKQHKGGPVADNGSRLALTLLILTFTTGLVDAVSFIGLGHVFTANMTGNVVFIAFALVGVPGLSALRSLVSLAAFVVGAAIGGRLARGMQQASQARRLTYAAIIECSALLAASGSALGYDYLKASPGWSLYAMIVLTAIAMGFRNATVLRLKDPDLKTTVLTLTITGLAADSSLGGGDNPRFGRRSVAVLALFAGAGVGAALLRYLGPATALLTMGACVAAATWISACSGRDKAVG